MILSGRKEIAEAIKENAWDISRLVKEEGLPAWRRSKRGTWKMLISDIDAWLKIQAEKYKKK